MMLRMAAGALLACCAALLLKRDNPLGGFFAALAFCAAALVALLPAVHEIVAAGRALLTQAGLDAALFSPLLRVLGISVCTRLCAELCRDARTQPAGGEPDDDQSRGRREQAEAQDAVTDIAASASAFEERKPFDPPPEGGGQHDHAGEGPILPEAAGGPVRARHPSVSCRNPR